MVSDIKTVTQWAQNVWGKLSVLWKCFLQTWGILKINIRELQEVWKSLVCIIFQKINICTLNLQTKNLRKQNHSQHVPMNLVKFDNQTLIETTIYNLHISCSWWWRRRTQSYVSWGTEFKYDCSNEYAR